MASAQTFHEGERCSHCWRTMPELTEPRALPCGHVSCTECLEVKYKIHKGVRCETCETIEEELDLKELPIAVLQETELPSAFPCDRQKCNKMAVGFCTDCREKICERHQKMHDGYYEEGHKVISITEFEQTSGKYQKSFCKVHKSEMLIKACENCKKLVCNQCDRTEGECSGKKTSHSYDELSAVAEKITTGLQNLLAKAAAKVGEFQKLDKNALDQLEKREEACDEWIDSVEKARQDHVQLLNQEYDKIVAQIQEVKQQADIKVLEFNDKLIHHRESLEAARKAVYQLVTGGSSEEIILLEDQVKEELRQHIDRDLGSPPLDDKYALIPKDLVATRGVEFIKLPSALSFSSEYSTGGNCFSACHRIQGDVLLGCEDGVKLLDKKTMKVTTKDLPYKTVTSVIEHNHNVYILHKHETTHKVEMLLPDMKHVETLFEFENSTNIAATMAVSDKYIAAYRPTEVSKGDLIIYDVISKELKYQSVNEYQNPYFTENGELLTASTNQSNIFKLENGEPVLSWTSPTMKNLHNVCSCSSGLIYGSTVRSQKVIYIFTATGEKPIELTHQKLPDKNSGQISIRGNELVVPGWYNSLVIFELKF